jgi:hypothetical protein
MYIFLIFKHIGFIVITVYLRCSIANLNSVRFSDRLTPIFSGFVLFGEKYQCFFVQVRN